MATQIFKDVTGADANLSFGDDDSFLIDQADAADKTLIDTGGTDSVRLYGVDYDDGELDFAPATNTFTWSGGAQNSTFAGFESLIFDNGTASATGESLFFTTEAESVEASAAGVASFGDPEDVLFFTPTTNGNKDAQWEIASVAGNAFDGGADVAVTNGQITFGAAANDAVTFTPDNSFLTGLEAGEFDEVSFDVVYDDLVGGGQQTITYTLNYYAAPDGEANDVVASAAADGSSGSSIDLGDGDDTLRGKPGDDFFDGGAGDDVMRGGSGDDTLDGGDGNDTVIGNDGADTLTGGAGDDRIEGHSGDDTIVDDGAGTDTVFGGDGDDTIDLSSAGDNGDKTVRGNADDDTITTGDGDDTLAGGFGDDVIDGGGGTNTIEGKKGDDTLTGGAGVDTMDGGAGDDSLTGGGEADDLTGGKGDDTLDGGDGDDTLTGSEGDDTLTGGADGDTFVMTEMSGTDTITDWNTGNNSVDLTALELDDMGLEATDIVSLLTFGNFVTDDGADEGKLEIGDLTIVFDHGTADTAIDATLFANDGSDFLLA